MENNLTYDLPILNNIDDLDNERKKVIEWVGHDKEVLEIGCHTGYMASWLNKRNCNVHGVEVNPAAIKKAEKNLVRAICGNIEDPLIWTIIKEKKYDTVLYMHVLEHLIDPWEILSKTNEILKPNGEVIIGLPNINSFRARFSILKGQFNYTQTGIFDKTHLRFFNIKTTREMISNAGFKELDYYSPWQQSIFEMMPFFWRLRSIGIKITNYISPNLSDAIIMFKLNSIKKNI